MIYHHCEKVTAKEKARQMVEMAVGGRMWELLNEITNDSVNDIYEPVFITEREISEVERHLVKYLDRLSKLVSKRK